MGTMRLRFICRIAKNIFSVSTLTALIASSPAYATLIEPNAAQPFEIRDYSFNATDTFTRDFIFTSPTSFSFEEPLNAIQTLNNFKPSDTYRDEMFRETQGRSLDAVTKIIDNEHVAARNTNPQLQVEIARRSTSAAPQVINEEELEAVSDPTQYVDQFIYNTATSYVRKSGVDVEYLQRSVGTISRSVSAVTDLGNQYIPPDLRDQPNTKTARGSIHILAFEETMPGRLFVWLSNPLNFAKAFVVIASALATVLGINLLIRAFAKSIRRRTR